MSVSRWYRDGIWGGVGGFMRKTLKSEVSREGRCQTAYIISRTQDQEEPHESRQYPWTFSLSPPFPGLVAFQGPSHGKSQDRGICRRFQNLEIIDTDAMKVPFSSSSATTGCPMTIPGTERVNDFGTAMLVIRPDCVTAVTGLWAKRIGRH